MAAAKPSGTEVSRRSLFTAAAAILGGFAASALGWMAPRSADAATKKIAQKVAQYQDTPKGSQHCAICTHFQPPSSCQLVAGTISPNGWCILFSPKSAKG